MPLWAMKAGAVLALLAGAWGHGRHVGAAGVQARWDAQVRADKDAADAARESDRLASHAAATRYEAARAAIAARAAAPSPEYRNALAAPICPVAGPLELGDVSVPAAVLQRLHDAGADY
jgi:hypothetical protein